MMDSRIVSFFTQWRVTLATYEHAIAQLPKIEIWGERSTRDTNEATRWSYGRDGEI